MGIPNIYDLPDGNYEVRGGLGNKKIADLIITGGLWDFKKVMEEVEEVGREMMITVSNTHYQWLKGRNEWLSALENAGVDNWSGYGDARGILDGEED